MEPEQDDVVVAQHLVHDPEVQQVVVPGTIHRLAAERGRVEHDPASVRQAVGRHEARERVGAPGVGEEQVGARPPQARREDDEWRPNASA